MPGNDSTLALILAVTALDGLVPLAAVLLPRAFLEKRRKTTLALASGVMLGAAAFDMVPDALESGLAPLGAAAGWLAGGAAFGVVDRLIAHHGDERSGIGPLILVGDFVHNFGDGIAIAIAFLVNHATGFATATGVILHELPHEAGDFTILVHTGYTRRRAMALLIAVQLSAVLGGAVTWFSANAFREAAPALLAACAGGFTYIAGFQLLPGLLRESPGERAKVVVLSTAALAAAGVALATRMGAPP